MNTGYHAIVGFLILLIGLSCSSALMAQDMYVDDADPREADQGASLNLKIIGRGFDNSVDKVSFKSPCNKKNCPDSDDIVVNGFVVKSDVLIEAQVAVLPEAPTQSYDIAVRSNRGRGGKGTTYKGEALFTVKKRPNQELLQCKDVVLDDNPDDPNKNYKNSCTCRFLWSGDAAFHPTLVEDCVTSETLYLKLKIRGDDVGSSDGSGNTTITARPCKELDEYDQKCTGVEEGNFSGTSVIENTSHRLSIRYMDIRFQDVERGCGSGIESAVSFVLDENIPDPRIPEPLNRNTFLNVRDIGIFSDDDPLCNAVEIIRTEGYTTAYSSGSEIARDWKVAINDNYISEGSYEHAGVVMLGMMPSESINPSQVVGNSIGAGVCGHPGDPVGILFGNLTPDPDRQIAGLVENNVIAMDSACPEDTGIQIVGDPGGVQTTVNVNKNTITGAYLGIDVDCDVVDVNFSGNNLSGDNSWPTGIFSEAQSSNTKGKPNRFSGYIDDYIFDNSGCF